MKIHYGKALSLSLVLGLASQFSAAAVLKDTPNKTGSDKQTSLIEKALDQQKRNPIVLLPQMMNLKYSIQFALPPLKTFLLLSTNVFHVLFRRSFSRMLLKI